MFTDIIQCANYTTPSPCQFQPFSNLNVPQLSNYYLFPHSLQSVVHVSALAIESSVHADQRIHVDVQKTEGDTSLEA